MRKRCYLDYAATAPLRPEAEAAWLAAAPPGNPASAHWEGRRARDRLDDAREAIAAQIGAQAHEVIFTSGGTEADGLAIQGIHFARQETAYRPHLLVSAVEHHAVLDNADLARRAKVVRLPVDPAGLVDLDYLAAYLRIHGDQTSMVSVMVANNETGALQPLAEVTELAAAAGVPVHADAVQAAGRMPINFAASRLAAISLSAHKLGGPVGVGALVARWDTPLRAVVGGGGQERLVRSGTVDARGAAGFAAALAAAVKADPGWLEGLLAPLDRLVGQHEALTLMTPAGHLPGLRLATVDGALGESLVYLADQRGFAVSAGAACTAGVHRPSHVLEAMGLSQARALGGLRVSVGHGTTVEEVEALVAALPEMIELAQRANAGDKR